MFITFNIKDLWQFKSSLSLNEKSSKNKITIDWAPIMHQATCGTLLQSYNSQVFYPFSQIRILRLRGDIFHAQTLSEWTVHIQTQVLLKPAPVFSVVLGQNSCKQSLASSPILLSINFCLGYINYKLKIKQNQCRKKIKGYIIWIRKLWVKIK